MARSLIAFMELLLACLPGLAQVEEVVTAKLERYSIAGLAMRVQSAKAFKHGVALFRGHPGILKLHEEKRRGAGR